MVALLLRGGGASLFTHTPAVLHAAAETALAGETVKPTSPHTQSTVDSRMCAGTDCTLQRRTGRMSDEDQLFCSIEVVYLPYLLRSI